MAVFEAGPRGDRVRSDCWVGLELRAEGGLELQGYRVGAPLPPQSPLSTEGIAEVKRALGALRRSSPRATGS